MLPPPACKFEPVYCGGVSVEVPFSSEEEEAVFQYNKRAPWEKSPLWHRLPKPQAPRTAEPGMRQPQLPSSTFHSEALDALRATVSRNANASPAEKALASTASAIERLRPLPNVTVDHRGSVHLVRTQRRAME